ncbi:Ger(x)C family spore germination protein [Paenibacillus psychroresistens]|uniref:Ger(X)C family spore germination protein n=1 Tax=Paenibacillus psychroresistens TaxID=1778678 RepID=A0A6B8RGC8_9BACL|nr:Ger(x)C family spore germination protein [Paenibacillus psychroresistens]QGQ94572.1 Ger(x)C family spore germination protein [Paenibacillus psychroresistens]
MIRAIIALGICSLLLLIAGCAFKDIDNRSFVFAIGIDKSNKEDMPYRVTLKVALPIQKIDPGKDNTQIFSQDSETISGAVRLIAAKLDKELDFGQTKIYMLGEGLAYESIKESLDWLSRKRDFQMEGYLALGRPSAESVLKLKPKSERYPGNALILSFGESGSQKALGLTEYLFDFYRRTTELGMDPYLPVIEVGSEVYIMNKAALLDKEKVKLILNPDESLLFMELLENAPPYNFRSKMGDTPIEIVAQKFKRHYSIETNNQKAPVIHVKIKIKGITEETSMPIYNDNWSQLERQIEEEEIPKYNKLLIKLQKNNIDPLGFGLLYRATHYKRTQDWEDWQSIYPNVKFEVDMKFSLRGTGLIK